MEQHWLQKWRRGRRRKRSETLSRSRKFTVVSLPAPRLGFKTPAPALLLAFPPQRFDPFFSHLICPFASASAPKSPRPALTRRFRRFADRRLRIRVPEAICNMIILELLTLESFASRVGSSSSRVLARLDCDLLRDRVFQLDWSSGTLPSSGGFPPFLV